MVAKTFTVPFAKNGNKTPIPDASDPSGFVSYDQGYGPDYERQLGVDPLAKDIRRENFNQALSDITVALQEIQSGQGQPAWSAPFAASLPGGVYPKGAIVPRADSNGWWISLNATAVDPATSAANWAPLGVQGSFTQALTNVNVTPTVSNAAYPVIVLTGTLTGNVQLILPAWVYRWTIINNCTGNFTVTVKLAASAGTVLVNGSTKSVVGTGTDILAADSSGSLLNVKIFTSNGTYTPTPGTQRIVVTLVGGGGGGGGTATSAAGQYAGAGGAGAGGFAKALITAGFASVAVTIGAGGTGGDGIVASGVGGTTSFGTMLTGTGGAGGGAGTPNTIPLGWSGGLGGVGSVAASSTVLTMATGRGERGVTGVGFTVGNLAAGNGGSSFFSGGGNGATATTGGGGVAPTNSGAGGGGASAGGAASNQTGGTGGAGFVTVEEYS